MGIQYAWHSDDRYYATVVKNQYRQLPLLLGLRSQAIIMWTFLSGFTLSSDLDFRTKWVFLLVITALACVFPYLVKRGIILKYRLRPRFGAETTFRMGDNEVVITGPGAGRFPYRLWPCSPFFRWNPSGTERWYPMVTRRRADGRNSRRRNRNRPNSLTRA
jgi:hypothetical protein